MVTICQKCGDKGWSVALIYCDKCQVAAEHRYCLDKLPATFTEHVTWFCEDCEQKVAKSTLEKPSLVPSRRSDRLRLVSQSAHVAQCKKDPEERIEARTVLKKNNFSETATKTKDQERKSSPSIEPCKAHDNENHEICEKQGRLMLEGIVNTDKEPEYSKINKDHKLEEAESSKIYKDQKLEEAEDSKINKKHKVEEAACSEINKHQKVEEAESSKFNKNQKRAKSGRFYKDQKLEEAESSKTNKNQKRAKSGMFYKDQKLEEAESSMINNDQKLEEAECIKINTNHKVEEAACSKINKNQKVDKAESSEDQTLEQRRRQLVIDKGNADEEAEFSKINISAIAPNDPSDASENEIYVPAQPIADPVWRGSFSISDKNFGVVDGLAAHLSTKACLKVCEEARLLPELIYSDMLLKPEVWPKSFKNSDPTDDNIALYFFPQNERDEKVFDSLVEHMIELNLAMRAVAVNAELLVFPSILLPLGYWRFKAKLYLWGVFRKKDTSSSQQVTVSVHPSALNSSNESAVLSDNVSHVSAEEMRDPRNTVSCDDSRSPISRLNITGSCRTYSENEQVMNSDIRNSRREETIEAHTGTDASNPHLSNSLI